MIEQYLSMLKPLGIAAPAVEFDLPERAAGCRIGGQVSAGQRAGQGGGFAVLNPGPVGRRRSGRRSDTVSLVRYLSRKHGLPSVAAWGLPSETPLAEAIVSASDGAQ